MRKLWLVLELAPVTWDLLQNASTAITAITRMLARLMATTVLITFWAACLLAPDRGSMASTVPATVVGFMAGATTGGVTTVAVASMDGLALAGAVLAGVRASQVVDPDLQDVAERSAADRSAAASGAALAASTVAVVSAAVLADSMVAVATEAGTGKTSHSSS